MDILAANIALIRSRWGMEQTEFAELFGVTRWAVGYWERGRSRPGLETIVRLESLAGFPLAVLLGRELEKGEVPERPLVDRAPVVESVAARLDRIEGMLKNLLEQRGAPKL